MDQDAFRSLLANARQSQPHAKQGPSTSANIDSQKAKKSASAGPAFKPRKVNKTEGKYRDRAAERRDGAGNDYAEVEAVLEDFERRAVHEDKNAIEQQRQYLGGDSQHTILVKGLDIPLLEQNRARVAVSVEDDETLEQAFAQATSASEPIEPRKRTREDIVRDLKARRQNGGEPADQAGVQKSTDDNLTLKAAKKAGKFKPIGFKPIGQTEEKLKKRKVKDKGDMKKKKRKVDGVQSGMNSELGVDALAISQTRDVTPASSSTKWINKLPEPEPEPLNEDIDIFAGAGEYEGFPDGEESESEENHIGAASASQEAILPAGKGWFTEPVPGVGDTSILPDEPPPIPETTTTEEEPQEVRLKPLESSALPSIRDFLAMDEAAEKAEKRKARKEKKRKKAGGDDDDD